MRNSRLQQQQQIMITVDRSSGILDLSVFAVPLKRGRIKTVGTAKLRMADLPEVLRLLTERLQFEKLLIEAEAAARKSKKRKPTRGRSWNRRPRKF